MYQDSMSPYARISIMAAILRSKTATNESAIVQAIELDYEVLQYDLSKLANAPMYSAPPPAMLPIPLIQRRPRPDSDGA